MNLPNQIISVVQNNIKMNTPYWWILCASNVKPDIGLSICWLFNNNLTIFDKFIQQVHCGEIEIPLTCWDNYDNLLSLIDLNKILIYTNEAMPWDLVLYEG